LADGVVGELGAAAVAVDGFDELAVGVGNAHPPGAYGASSPPKFVLGATRLRANGRGCVLGGGGGWGLAGEAGGVGLGGPGGGCEMAEGKPEDGEAGRRGAARALWEKGCERERDPAEEPR
jgi:hypothetical protein